MTYAIVRKDLRNNNKLASFPNYQWNERILHKIYFKVIINPNHTIDLFIKQWGFTFLDVKINEFEIYKTIKQARKALDE